VTNLGLIYWPLANGDVMTSANKAYQGAGVSVRTPFKRHRYRPKLSRRRTPQDLENPGQAALQPLLDGRNGGAVLVVHHVASHLDSAPARLPKIKTDQPALGQRIPPRRIAASQIM
jgi:hypothetical protein